MAVAGGMRRRPGGVLTHSINLVEDFPLLVRNAQSLGRLDGAFQLAGPHLQIHQLLVHYEIPQSHSKLHTHTIITLNTK